MALFSLLLTKYNFVASALLHLVVLRGGTSFHKIETFKVFWGFNHSFRMHHVFIWKNYMKPYQVSMSNTGTQSLEVLSERILEFLQVLSAIVMVSKTLEPHPKAF